MNFSDPFGLCPPCTEDYSQVFVILGREAPAMQHELVMFLPKNFAAALGGIAIGAGLGRAAGLIGRLLRGGSEIAAEGGVGGGASASAAQETGGR